MPVSDHKCKYCGKHETGNWIQSRFDQLKERQLCFSCNHWYSLSLKKNSPKTVRVDGSHYYIGPNDNTVNRWRGFAGKKFKIKFFDGREVETNNLWHQGKIPEIWKERLPNNAKFITK